MRTSGVANFILAILTSVVPTGASGNHFERTSGNGRTGGESSEDSCKNKDTHGV